MPRIAAATLLALYVAALVLTPPSRASDGLPVLNPKTYVSSSGVFSVLVDPTDIHGCGPADYRFARHGETICSKRLPFTLWDARVSDSGYAVGYAYTHSVAGFVTPGAERPPGRFIVALLSPDGKIVRKETHDREDSRYPDHPSNPLAAGLLMDEQNGRFIVRVCDPDLNRGEERWWVFDMETGERIRVLKPCKALSKFGGTLRIFGAEVVPGTPLVLTHWWHYTDPSAGAIFALVDPVTGKLAWKLSLDDDYTFPGDESQEDRVQDLVQERGAILGVTGTPSFDLYFAKEKKAVRFVIRQVKGGSWRVLEESRRPYEPVIPPAEPLVYPPTQLERLGTVQLGEAKQPGKSAIDNLNAFEFDDQGRIGAIRMDPHHVARLLRLSQDGEVLKDISFPLAKDEASLPNLSFAYVGGGKFMIALSNYGASAKFLLADFDTGAVKRIPVADCPEVKRLTGFPDGRFVVLGCTHGKYSTTHVLCMFDADGKCLWKKEGGGISGKPDEFLSPVDVTRTGSGAVAVLDCIGHTIQFFDERGDFVRVTDLRAAWGRRPNYPTNIARDGAEGFVVYDFNADKPLVRLDGDGRIKGQFRARFPDGRPFSMLEGARCSPHGELWTCDRTALLRLSEDAVVDRILGSRPDPVALSMPGCMAVGPDDRLYLSDVRTHAVHAFDPSGKKIGVCVPDPADLSELSSVGCIAVSATGDVFVLYGGVTYVQFGKDFKRRGSVKLDLDDICQQWHFCPTGDLCWIGGYNDVFLTKGLTGPIRKVSRRADGLWLEEVRELAVAPDGSVAVMAVNQREEGYVTTFSPAGDALATFTVPADCGYCSMAYNGQVVALRREAEVLFFRADGGSMGRFSLESVPNNAAWLGPVLAAQGKQLWFVDAENLTLHKYATPTPPATNVHPPEK